MSTTFALGVEDALKDRRTIGYWRQRLEGLDLNLFFEPAATGEEVDEGWQESSFPAPAPLSRRYYEIAGTPGARHLFLLVTLLVLAEKYSGLTDLGIFTRWDIDEGEGGFRIFPFRITDSRHLGLRQLLELARDLFVRDLEQADCPLERMLSVDREQLAVLPAIAMSLTSGKAADGTTIPDLDPLSAVIHFCFYVIPGTPPGGDPALSLTIRYRSGQFGNRYIDRLALHFFQLSERLISAPGQPVATIELPGAEEKAWLSANLDHTGAGYSKKDTIVDLFRIQAALRPGETALIYGAESMSYRELDDRSEALGKVLRKKGVCRNKIVGLLTDRSPGTIVGMLGILKAGGAYVPIDIDYPEERKKYIIENSRTELVVTTAGWMKVPGEIDHLCLEDVEDRSVCETEPPAIDPADLCYIIYTSGTTGSPKGVMIEHRNVVRLLFNESFPFDFGSGDTWTMFHSPCFDFSVWEMYGALLYGGRLLIIPRETARDPRAFLGVLRSEGVTVLNQTPSAFYQLISEELSGGGVGLGLRYVIFGGEALSPGRLGEWKGRYPSTRLINMFGITETTVHVTYKEIGEWEIGQNISNIGRPIPTLSVYILDDRHRPVPVGVIGELYVGGAGIARGYCGKEELTKKKFLLSPFDGRERLYRSGDLGRFLVSGEIEYIGRIDHQVQLRGFRIELEEVGSHLATHPAMEQAVVVMRGRDEEKYLVAYYTAEEELKVGEIRNYLQERLPDYMVPAYYVRLPAFPLTGNGKLDREALPEAVAQSEENYAAPATREEHLLAGIWATVLGMKQIGVTDNFFSAGGDSIKSVQLSARVRQAGYEVSVKDIFMSPTIREQAKRLRPLSVLSDQSSVEGVLPLTPIQRWFWEGDVTDRHYYNQSVLLRWKGGLSGDQVRAIAGRLLEHHDALRMTFRGPLGEAENRGVGMGVWLLEEDLRGRGDEAELLGAGCRTVAEGMDLSSGPLMRLGLFHLGDGSRLYIAIHHLVVDGVSWRILLEDITTLYGQLQRGAGLVLPAKTDSYRSWSRSLEAYAGSDRFNNTAAYWQAVAAVHSNLPEKDFPDGSGLLYHSESCSFELDAEATDYLLTEVHRPFHTQVNDVLLTALALSVEDSFALQRCKIDVEGHGREFPGEGGDVGRTVGWFTSIYPVVLETVDGEMGATLCHIKETLRNIPHGGRDFLLHSKGRCAEDVRWSFNYLGQFDTDTQSPWFVAAREQTPADISAKREQDYEMDITGHVADGRLYIHARFSKCQYKKERIAAWLINYRHRLLSLVEYCRSRELVLLTPSDLSVGGVPAAVLSGWQAGRELEDVYPLSPLQEGILFHWLREPGGEAYFEQVSYRWKGELDVGAVERSVGWLVKRYGVLRTVFVWEGYDRPMQLVLRAGSVPVRYADVRAAAAEWGGLAVRQASAATDRQEGFDLGRGPLLRLTVLRTGEEEYEFIWSFHHIILDGWCMGLVLEAYQAAYARGGFLEGLGKEAVGYGRYIAWLEGLDKEGTLSYWREYLRGYGQLSTLPRGSRGGEAAVSYKRCKREWVMGGEPWERLQASASGCGVTLHTVFQTAWGVLLSRYNDVSEVVFGMVVSGRPAELFGVEEVVGLFINTVPVRLRVEEEEPVRVLWERVQREAVQGEGHRYHPLSEIQAVSELGRGLLDHVVVFENYPLSQEGYGLEAVEMEERTSYDLSVVVVVGGGELRVRLEYNGSVYEPEVIDRLTGHLGAILKGMTEVDRRVGELELLGEAERLELEGWNATGSSYPAGVTMLELLEVQVGRIGDRVAVSYKGGSMSYGELWERSGRVAGYLCVQGMEAGELVGVWMERSALLLPVLVGIWRAGGAYVPLDRRQPEERTAGLIVSAGVRWVLSEGSPGGMLKERTKGCRWIEAGLAMGYEGKGVDREGPGPGDLAYVIYTSGSTGQPKGVMIEHGSVVNRLWWMQAAYPLGRGDVVMQKTPMVFDVSVWELFWWMVSGSGVYLLGAGEEKDPWAIVSAVEGRGVTVLHFVPSMLRVFLGSWEAGWRERLVGLRYVFSSGEALGEGEVRLFYGLLGKGVGLINLYGPTEATVDVSYYECTGEERGGIPIGRPIANTRLYVLDRWGRSQGIGVPGELWIGGVGVGRGYLGQAELTGERFVERGGERMYRTGDWARWNGSGELEYLGRRDSQVKIRGHRVELGEIERQLGLLAGEGQVAVMWGAERGLVGYYTPGAGVVVTEESLRAGLSERLPEYMVPQWYVRMEAWPLTTNGKLDRKALPPPAIRLQQEETRVSNETEAILVKIWAEVLHLEPEKIGILSNFFELGGHSIGIIQLTNKIKERFRCNLSVPDIFRLPNIRVMADYLQDGRLRKATSETLLEKDLDEREEALDILSSRIN